MAAGGEALVPPGVPTLTVNEAGEFPTAMVNEPISADEVPAVKMD
jgi:hypothetical protein